MGGTSGTLPLRRLGWSDRLRESELSGPAASRRLSSGDWGSFGRAGRSGRAGRPDLDGARSPRVGREPWCACMNVEL